MKTVMFAHGGSDNHGCEAIVRSTCKILKSNTLLSSFNSESDRKYGIAALSDIVDTVYFNRKSIGFIFAYLKLKLLKDTEAVDRYTLYDSVSQAEHGDIALSIGGDNYCYVDYQKYIRLHSMYKERGAKTVLWGCSVDPELLENPAIRDDIASFDLITARETLSFEALKKVNPNTVLVSDPAFVLNCAEVELPDYISGKDIVGINVSPLILKYEDKPLAFENYRQLCRHILDNTDYSIMLLPHVVTDGNDDRTVLQRLYDELGDSGRVFFAPDCDCEHLKGYISKCRFFVAARTHSSIAAYSMKIPTLVVGYSVKAKGIAKDIFGDYSGRVLPVQELSTPTELTKAFIALEARESEEKAIYFKVMDDYVNKAYLAVEAVRRLVDNAN